MVRSTFNTVALHVISTSNNDASDDDVASTNSLNSVQSHVAQQRATQPNIAAQKAMNPYSFTEPVRRDEMFFGRGELLNELLVNFSGGNPQSFSLVGGRRMGKTSLLRALERKLLAHGSNHQRALGGSVYAVPVYIDLNFDSVHTRADFFALALERLGEVLITAGHAPSVDWSRAVGALRNADSGALVADFERLFVDLRTELRPQIGALQAVLLVDEAEHMIGQEWASQLHSNLRALLSNRPLVQDNLSLIMAGSSDFYTRISEEGSPLRNILIKRLLHAFNEDEMRALMREPIHGTLPLPVEQAVSEAAGGHPFLAQYLLHDLCRSDPAAATVEQVQDRIDAFIYERDDFEDWMADIDEMGERVYALLDARTAGEQASGRTSEAAIWMSRRDLFRAVAGDRGLLRRALEALVYHGVVLHERRLGYRTLGEMFRSWFRDFRAAPVTLSPSIEPDAIEKPGAAEAVEIVERGGHSAPVPTAAQLPFFDEVRLQVTDARVRIQSSAGEASAPLALDAGALSAPLRAFAGQEANGEQLKQLGSTLYAALLPTEVRALFDEARAGARAQRRGVRLRLDIESPSLAALPWETLYEAATDTFFATSRSWTLSRYVRVRAPHRPPLDGSKGLHVLVIAASPAGLPEPGIDEEVRELRAALKHADRERTVERPSVRIDVEEQATLRRLNHRLRDQPPQVVHFIGHGIFQNERAHLALEEEDGSLSLVDEETFGRLLGGDHLYPNLSGLYDDGVYGGVSLVVLNACQTATVSTERALSGAAPRLVQRGVPSVIAMQLSVDAATAALLTGELYRSLVRGLPIDAALQEARYAVALAHHFDRVDFAAPVLFMRSQ